MSDAWMWISLLVFFAVLYCAYTADHMAANRARARIRIAELEVEREKAKAR